jgi:hypothetical protein
MRVMFSAFSSAIENNCLEIVMLADPVAVIITML